MQEEIWSLTSKEIKRRNAIEQALEGKVTQKKATKIVGNR